MQKERRRQIVCVSIAGEEGKTFHEKVLSIISNEEPPKDYSTWVREREAEFVTRRLGY